MNDLSALDSLHSARLCFAAQFVVEFYNLTPISGLKPKLSACFTLRILVVNGIAFRNERFSDLKADWFESNLVGNLGSETEKKISCSL